MIDIDLVREHIEAAKQRWGDDAVEVDTGGFVLDLSDSGMNPEAVRRDLLEHGYDVDFEYDIRYSDNTNPEVLKVTIPEAPEAPIEQVETTEEHEPNLENERGHLVVEIDGEEITPKAFYVDETGTYRFERRGDKAEGIGPVEDIDCLVYTERDV